MVIEVFRNYNPKLKCTKKVTNSFLKLFFHILATRSDSFIKQYLIITIDYTIKSMYDLYKL